MLLVCELCDVSSRYYGDWCQHLLSLEHQELTTYNLHTLSYDKVGRSAVAWNFDKPVTRNELVDHFSSFGFIHDIYFNWHKNEIKSCIVVMDTKLEAAKIASNINGSRHSIGKRAVTATFSRRSDMSWEEWNRVIGNTKVESFLKKHKLMTENMKDKSLDDDFSQFMTAITLNQEQIDLRYHVLTTLDKWIKEDYQYCTLQPFGSFLSGISSSDGDIDVFVDVNGLQINNNQNEHPKEVSVIIEVLVKRLKKAFTNRWDSASQKNVAYKLFSYVLPLPKTRVPIIRLIHTKSDIHVDLSFNSHLSVQNSKLIKFFVEYDPRVRPLLVLIRYWGRYHNLTGSDKIKNYALVLIVIVFLNQKMILPYVDLLQTEFKTKLCTPSIDKNGWNGEFYSNVEDVRKYVSSSDLCNRFEGTVSTGIILNLAKDFFKFYAALDMEQSVLCPLLGMPISKKLFHKENPDLVEISWKKMTNFTSNKPMCVQDPFVLNFNVTHNVRQPQAMKFKAACQVTYRNLDTMLEKGGCQNRKINIMDMFTEVEVSNSRKEQPSDESRTLPLPEILRNLMESTTNRLINVETQA